jgi:anaerobic ribonucleoside-triphosphate reductase
MSFPIKVCSVCGEEFELKPDKPGFANRCPDCSTEDEEQSAGKHAAGGLRPTSEKEMNDARRQAMRDLLYRKDS